jgi:DNA-binding LytR/AlgR family response regulator
MKIKAVVVDDEPHAIDIIVRYLAHFPEVELIETCKDGMSAFHTLQRKGVDLIFLDVKMPGINGVELLKSLKNPPKVVFTTAFTEYAVEGFELDAVDYLVKPISFNRFLKAMDKVLSAMGAKKQAAIFPESTYGNDINRFLYLKVDRKTVKVNVKDIYWIESIRDYVKVILIDKVLISKQKISILEELLPEDQFCRIHKSFIVSTSKVESYYAHAVEILGKELPIGRNYKQQALKCLQLI